MRLSLFVLFYSFISIVCSAQNAFTIHRDLHSSVNVYYDTLCTDRQLLIRIYPHPEFKCMSKKALKEWVHRDKLFICGAEVTVIQEAGNNTFLVKIGNEFLGYVKRGHLAVSTRNYDGQILYLYDGPEYASCKKEVSRDIHYARITGKKEDWFFVTICDKHGHSYVGWLPPDMQCHSFLTTCP